MPMTLAQQAVLVGPDLEPQGVVLRSYSPEGVVVVDWRGNERTLSSDEVLRLTLSTAPTRVAEDLAIVRLRDGQVLVGTWHGMGQDGDAIGLALLGDTVQSVPLDDLLNFSFVDEVPWPGLEQESDTLTLKNGEVLTGFIDAIADSAILFVLDDADDPIAVPFDRFHAFSVSNRPRPIDPEPGMVRVALYNAATYYLRNATTRQGADGTLVLVGETTLDYGPASHAFALDMIQSIEPVSGSSALSALSGFSFEVLAGGEVFGVPMPPRVDEGGAIVMHAPTTLGFDLPQGASRVVMSVSLDLDALIPRERRALAGCELVVYDGNQVIGGATLEPGQVPQRINLPLTGGELRLELRAGVNGPILDRVRITDAEVLVSNR